MGHWVWVARVAFFGLLVGARPAAPVFGTEGDGPPAPAEAPVELPSLPAVHLAPLDDESDEGAYIHSIAQRAAALAEQAAQLSEPLDRSDKLLAAANLILSYQLEPACTRRFLGLPMIGSGADDAEEQLEPRGALDTAAGFLTQAGAALQALANPEPEVAEAVGERSRVLNVLQAFAKAQRAYLVEEGSDGSDARTAASELSPLMENADPKVAAAAKLWQAVLRSREEDLTPALLRLGLVLADPSEEAMPYAFFARLLRCRLLAERGHPATGLALLLQVEERVQDDWLPIELRSVALRTIALVRVQTLKRWFRSLPAETDAASRAWFPERIRDIIDQRFAEMGATVMRLSPAVPIVARLPAAEDVPTEPSAADPQ